MKFQTVTVAAVQGATLRGPVRVKLTKEQHAPRVHVLGPWKKKSGNVDTFDLDGGQALTFKRGEEIGIDLGSTGRLNRAIFDWLDPEEKKSAAPKDNGKASGGGNDTAPGGSGDDTAPGGNGDDTAPGGSGNDTASGGNGDDTAPGGNGDDTAPGASE